MRIVKELPEREFSRSKPGKVDRRRFLKTISFAVALYFIPLSACKRLLNKGEPKPEATELSVKEMQVLQAVQSHMLPSDGRGPGAGEINADKHYSFVLKDKHLELRNRKLLINGVRWVEETAIELYGKGFLKLTHAEKEASLRDLESYKNGERWLSKVYNYLMEALLGAPAYGVNTGKKGWIWLGHIPGVPQPGAHQIYGSYGYGV